MALYLTVHSQDKALRVFTFEVSFVGGDIVAELEVAAFRQEIAWLELLHRSLSMDLPNVKTITFKESRLYEGESLEKTGL